MRRGRILIAPVAAALALAATPSPANAVTLQLAAVVAGTSQNSPYIFVLAAEAVTVPDTDNIAGVVGSCQAVIVPPPNDANVRCWVDDGADHFLVSASDDVGVPAVQLGVGTTVVNTNNQLSLCVQAVADGFFSAPLCRDFLPNGLT